LHPEYPPEGIPRAELVRRYGAGLDDRLAGMFDEAGLPYTAARDKVPNSRRALMLSELAQDRSRHAELHPRLFDAYWARGLDLGDEAVLVAEGKAVGLDAQEINAAIHDPAYLERVTTQTTQASELGAGGVPAWVIDRRLLVPGAQPHEVFERVLDRLGYTPTD
jgi:predicted DsbA family dithiol-disulfide isomerase